jgi:hypothetical protein
VWKDQRNLFVLCFFTMLLHVTNVTAMLCTSRQEKREKKPPPLFLSASRTHTLANLGQHKYFCFHVCIRILYANIGLQLYPRHLTNTRTHTVQVKYTYVRILSQTLTTKKLVRSILIASHSNTRLYMCLHT